MSGYENVVGGRLKLKGKALDVKDGEGIKKKMKHKKKHYYAQSSHPRGDGLSKDGERMPTTDQLEDENDAEKADRQQSAACDIYLTPVERRYLQQWEKLDRQRLAKRASKSHRDRIQEFNQYLANLSEHYDIPKVGPG